ncbi:ABC transporter permease [Roseibium denhamense]|nr:ABC transporter permease [Roseibium denhamense]
MGLVFVWHVLVKVSGVEPYMVPGPIAVGETLWGRAGFLLYHASITAYETLLGLFFGVTFGAILAVSLWLFPMARKVTLPVLLVTQSLPVFAIAPVLVLWFGFGLASKIIMATLVIFFAITSTFYDGLRRLDPGLSELSRLYRLSRFQEFRLLRLPSAMPAFASGIRIAAAFAPIGAIVGEWVGAKGGLAFILLQFNARAQTDVVFAALILLATMVLVLRYVADYATRFLAPWQTED